MLSEFLSKLNSEGISKPSLYVVEIVDFPLSVSAETQGFAKDLRFFVEAAEFPGTQILTQDVRPYDIPEKIAYAKMHDDVTLTFRVDRDMKVKRFFDEWVDSIYNHSTGNLRYKSEYQGTIRISQVDEFGKSPYGLELTKAFPIQVQTMSLGWEQANAYHKLNVQFTFHKMERVMDPTTLLPLGISASRWDSDLMKIVSATGAVQKITKKLPPGVTAGISRVLSRM